MEPGADYTGMTVNERLFAAELLGEFDAAVRGRDRGRMVEILKRVQIPEAEAESTVERLLTDPQKYGY